MNSISTTLGTNGFYTVSVVSSGSYNVVITSGINDELLTYTINFIVLKSADSRVKDYSGMGLVELMRQDGMLAILLCFPSNSQHNTAQHSTQYTAHTLHTKI